MLGLKRETLHRLYIVEKLSANHIAKLLSTCPKTVAKYLKKHNIEMRTPEEVYDLMSRQTGDRYRPYADREWLAEAYKTHTRVEIASMCEVSVTIISRFLKRFNIRDKEWEWTEERRAAASQRSQLLWFEHRDRLGIRTPEQRQLISDTLKAKWANDAEFRANALQSISESRHSSRGVVVSYQPIKSPRRITFRSLAECAYAMLLDANNSVNAWEYETVKLDYVDNFSGKPKVYILDFRVVRGTSVEHIEVKPLELQEPLTKYLYAANHLENWRFSSAAELAEALATFRAGYRKNYVDFCLRWPRAHRYVAWSKTGTLEIPPGWRQKMRLSYGAYFRHRLVNMTYTAKTSQPTQSTVTANAILDLVMAGELQRNISARLSISTHTVNNILERASYYVRWSHGRGTNIIYHAGRQIWPV